MKLRHEKTVDIELNDISEKLMLNYLSISGEGRGSTNRRRLVPCVFPLFESNEVRDMVVDEDRSHEPYSNKFYIEKSEKINDTGGFRNKFSYPNRSSSLPPVKGSRMGSNIRYNGEGLNLLNNCGKKRVNSGTLTNKCGNNMRFECNRAPNGCENRVRKSNMGHKIHSSATDIVNSTEAYTKLFVNIILVLTTLYIVFGVIFVIKNDIESKIQISTTNIIEEMNLCSKQYVDNKCQPDLRVPAMESKCNEWERCMSQNPTIIARKSIFTAQIIGEILNTFFDQISFKSALFIFGFIIALLIGNFFVIKTSIGEVNKSNKVRNNSCINEENCEIVKK
ncbi:hypothetical protein FG386_002374 [Cryptosporidium ryanae]|uniref:uncharacterized protein n=1 Tax=Cryptosporidium ryanae TaxID=515981 RepID=UPI003519E72E|nr:hypothetical protein FG386_002374 [Cryptosporidium ryanae]